jgi:microcystin-dependent protein
MSTTTKNYNFILPSLSDSPPDITSTNSNWEMVDQKLKTYEGQISESANIISTKQNITDNSLATTDKTIVGAINEILSKIVPVGMIGFFALSSPSVGFLVCNGANVSRTTYAALFAKIGTTFGTGDGSTTFTLPDLNNEFIRGTTNTGTRAIGNKQAGSRIASAWTSFNSSNCFTPKTDNVDSTSTYTTNNEGYVSPNYSNNINQAMATIRPQNTAMLPCIKY